MIHHLLSKRILHFLSSILRNVRAIESGEKRNEGEGVMHKRTVERQREKEEKKREPVRRN